MKNALKPIEYRRYIDEQTGEVHEVPVVIHFDKKNKDFEMIFYGHLLDILNDLGNKRIQVLQHIIKNRSRTENTFIGTIRDIANDLDISFVTVQNTLVILEDKGVIKRRTGVIYIDGDLICDGRFKGHIMHIYNDLEEESEEDKELRLQREIERMEQQIVKLQSIKQNIRKVG